ncbi:hypothetical protein ACLB2K_014278 [Fragaria x ananassa]
MASSQPTQDSRAAIPMEQILQLFEELKIQGLATQQSVTDLAEHVKKDRSLWKASHNKLTMLSEDYGHLEGKFTKTKGLVKSSLQQTQKELGQTTNVLNMTHAIADKHGLAKKIKLPSSQSNGEDFLLDEPTSKEETILLINDEEPEIEAGEIMDNNSISKSNGVPQKDELEGMTKQSTLEEEIGSNIDGKPQFRMKGYGFVTSFSLSDLSLKSEEIISCKGRLNFDQFHQELISEIVPSKICIIVRNLEGRTEPRFAIS